jgi:hypothetical protein
MKTSNTDPAPTKNTNAEKVPLIVAVAPDGKVSSSHRSACFLVSNVQLEPAMTPLSVADTLPASLPSMNSAERCSKGWLEGDRDVRLKEKFTDLLEVMSTVARSDIGTGVVVGAERDGFGARRYSASVNEPSGGTNEKARSRAKRCRLCRLVSATLTGFHKMNLPDTRMECTVSHDFGITESQQNIGRARQPGFRLDPTPNIASQRRSVSVFVR